MEDIQIGISRDLPSKGCVNVHVDFHFSHNGFPVSAVIWYQN